MGSPLVSSIAKVPAISHLFICCLNVHYHRRGKGLLVVGDCRSVAALAIVTPRRHDRHHSHFPLMRNSIPTAEQRNIAHCCNKQN